MLLNIEKLTRVYEEWCIESRGLKNIFGHGCGRKVEVVYFLTKCYHVEGGGRGLERAWACIIDKQKLPRAGVHRRYVCQKPSIRTHTTHTNV